MDDRRAWRDADPLQSAQYARAPPAVAFGAAKSGLRKHRGWMIALAHRSSR
jgi:hypothetical protein